MALNNSTDGLWFSKNSSTTRAVKEFTRSVPHTGSQSALKVFRFTHTPYNSTYLHLTWWIRFCCGRTDGNPGYVSGGWWKGHILYAAGYWERRYDDTYGRSDIGFNYWPRLDWSGNTLEFNTHLYGAPGWSNIVTYNIIAMYQRWDLVTVSFP